MFMNICIFSDLHISQQRGGVEKVSFVLAEAFKKRGHNVTMLSALGPISDDLLLPNQFILPDKPTYSEKNILFAKKIFKEKKIDIIINQSETLSTYNFLKNTREHIPLITCFHTSPEALLKNIDDNWDFWRYNIGTIGYYTLYPYVFLRKKVQQYYRSKYIKEKFYKLYTESDAVVLLSEKYITPFRNIAKIRNCEKILVIHNPETKDTSNNNVEKVEKENIILYVGRLVFHPKRIDRMLKIWSKIKQKGDWRLIIIGDGSDKKFLKNLSIKLKNRNVDFVGQQEPTFFYQKAKILCLTSTCEGSPCVIREAKSHNTIPISFDSFESVTDYITNGTNGFIIKAFNLKQYAQTLSRLMHDKNLLSKIQNNIAQEVKNNDSLNEKIIKDWETLFGKLHKSNNTN